MIGVSNANNRFFDIFLLTLLLVALLLLAVAVGGGSLAEPTTGEQPSPAEQVSRTAGVGAIGGGSLGGSEYNPIGAGIANETNPFESSSDTLQFTVSSDQPHYWRVDGYDTYDNGTWSRSEGYQNYDDDVSPVGRVSEETTHQISLERRAAALPAGWQPARTTAANQTGIAVSAEGGFHTADQLPSGAQFTVTTYTYTPDKSQLLFSRSMYPEHITEKYTRLPNSTTTRTKLLAEDVTAGAVTPVQSACAVQEWIKTNKQYDPTTTHSGDRAPVDEYLFEMDGGTAEYAASSMVVLLRSENIPARYVTGYSPGTVRGDDQYGVYAVNAHAWVEVYASGHGWIPFDPTSAAERKAFEADAIGSDRDIAQASLPADCSLRVDIEPLPDHRSNLTISSDSQPSQQLRSEDETLQQVTSETDSIQNIESEENPPQQISSETTESDQQIISETDSEPQTIQSETTPLLVDNSGSTGDGSTGDGSTGDGSTGDGSVTSYPNVTITPYPDPLIAGGNATIEVLLNNEPLPDATVVLGNETIGTTNTTGVVTTTLPDRVAQSQLQLVVEEGAIREERSVRITQFKLSATPAQTLGLPDQNVTLHATAGSEPLRSVRISRDNTTVGTTDTNGSVSVPLDTFTQTTFSANYVGKEATVQVQNRLLPLGLRVISVFFIFSIVLIVIDRQYNVFTPSRRRVLQLSDRFYGSVRSTLLRSTRMNRMLKSTREQGLWTWMITLIKMVRIWISSLWSQLPQSPFGYLATFGKQTLQVFVARFRGGDDPKQQSAESRDDGSTLHSTTAENVTGYTVQQIWTTFIRLVFGHVIPTQTPGEVARAAIDKGFPQKPVNRLTNAFRVAEYGPAEPDETQTEAKAALSEIESIENPPADSNEPRE